ncbi:MAG TPA: low molecular weight protein-tyrosine-phosphatase [Solirubrobacteraceae bacterium]|jgi:protein-tyrosine phosphatase
MQILFVCLGNICRSPTAEGVMRKLVAEAELQDEIGLDSAGTGAWHVGERPDARARAPARARGIELDSVARQVRTDDFERFDLILAMDASNRRALRQLAPDEPAREKVRLLREFDPLSADAHDLDVPDPYYDSQRGFEIVLDQVQAACEGLLEYARESGSARAPEDRG